MTIERCESYIERDKKVIAPCQHLSYFPLVIDKVKGSVITDLDGNEYIDFLASNASLTLGSSNPVLTKAILEQIEKFTQFSQVYTYNKETIEYAERLVSVYPGGVPAKVCFGNGGSDSNDAAVKFARAYTGRPKIITFINGYHGNTLLAASMSSCTTRMKSKMGPVMPEIYYFPFYGNDLDDETVERECLKDIETAFETYMPANEVAAVIIEPVQGDAGLIPAHPIFMKKLYELCKANGILFFAEEVQQAFYRTGKFFSIEHYDIIPDGIVMGKAIGASLTLGAFMAKAEIMDCLPAPAHLFTLGGNAIACAAGIAAFDYYQTEEFQTRLATNIAVAERCAAKLKEKHPNVVGFTRNLGMSMGIGVCHPDGTADKDGCFKVLFRCYQLGLIVISLAGNVLRIQPSLVIEPELLEKGFDIIDQAMTDYENGLISDDVMVYRAGW